MMLIGYLSFQFVAFTLDHILVENRKTKAVTVNNLFPSVAHRRNRKSEATRDY